MKVALLTATYGGYDSLKFVEPQRGNVEQVCVTDDPSLNTPGWKILYIPQDGVHPNTAAKQPKMLPWRFTAADAFVWIDASFRVTSPRFVESVLEFADPIAQFVHPDRDDIYDEAVFSSQLARYTDQKMIEQVDRYRPFHPEHWGLWATGVIAWHKSRTTEVFGNAWHKECEDFTYQDQLSEAPMLNLCGLRPTTLPGNHLCNDWLSFEPEGH